MEGTRTGYEGIEVPQFSEHFLHTQESAVEQKENDRISFSEWKARFDAVESFQEALLLLQEIPFDDSSIEFDAFVFGEDGLLEQAKKYKTDPPLPSISEDELYAKESDHLREVDYYVEEYGWQHAVLTELARACDVAPVEKAVDHTFFQKRIVILMDAFLDMQSEVKKADEMYAENSEMYAEDDEEWDDGNLDEQELWEMDENMVLGLDGDEGQWETNMLLKKSRELGNGYEVGMHLLERISDLDEVFYTKTLAHHFSLEQPTDAAKALLNIIREPSISVEDKSVYRRILYLLEFGKIGIDQGVVTYLEQQYVLEHSDDIEMDFARRITGDGKIGIFNAQGGLEGYFELGALDTEEKKRQAQVLEVARDMLFADPNTPDNIRTQFLADYTDFYEQVFGEVGGVRMSDLTLKEQVWMYQFWKESDDTTWEKAVQVKEDFGIQAVRTFIATEQEAEIGNQVVDFANREDISRDLKDRVFSLYSEFISKIDRIRDVMKEELSAEISFDDSVVSVATKEIAKRAYLLLKQSIDTPSDLQLLEKQLSDVHKDFVIFSAIFKAQFKGKGKVEFSQLEGIDFMQIAGTSLSEDTKKAMVHMARKNYVEEPHVAEELGTLLFSNEQELQKNAFCVLTRKNENDEKEVVAFLRAKKQKNGSVYIGGFNVDTNTRGSGIGEQMIMHSLEQLHQQYDLEANAVLELQAGTHYVEHVGFVGKGFNLNREETETFHGWFDLELPKDPPMYRLREPGVEIVQVYNEAYLGTNPLELADTHDVIIAELDFSSEDGIEEVRKVMDELLNKRDFTMTRYQCVDASCSKRICGFEKVDKMQIEEFSQAA